MQLTKEADAVICQIYKTYLELRRSGVPKEQAKSFQENYLIENPYFSSWYEDADNTLDELHNKELIKKDIIGNFKLEDEGIIYMENRFVNGLNEVLDFISKIKL